MFKSHRLLTVSLRHAVVALVAVGATLVGGCASSSPDYQKQQSFQRPEDAVSTLVSAAQSGDTARLEAIFGPDARDILMSSDPIADRNHREVFITAASERWSLERINNSTKELVIGHERWPFPVPLTKDSHGWWFNTAAGKWEVLARRIGRNELAAIGTLRTYVLSQREYAAQGHDGKSAGIYAQRIRSDAGMHNGLYWPVAGPADAPSPLGEFAAAASAEGYGTQPREGMAPYHGYFYRILTRQGPNAPGGAMDYVVNGDMTRGFAMIAYPAEYGNSGIMTFIVGTDGVVWDADLGQSTTQTAGQIQEFDPDARWRRVN